MATRSLPAGEGPALPAGSVLCSGLTGTTTATSEPNCIPGLRTQPQGAFQNPHQRGLWCWERCNMTTKVGDLGRRSQNLPACCQEACQSRGVLMEPQASHACLATPAVTPVPLEARASVPGVKCGLST